MAGACNQQVAENPEKYNAANYPEVFNFANTDASLGIIEASNCLAKTQVYAKP